MHSIGNMGRRAFMSSAAAAALLLENRSVWAKAPGGRWPKVTPPQPPRISNLIEQLGRTRDDAYSWMKFIPASGERDRTNLPPAVAKMLADENAYADAVLKPTEGEQAELLRAMLARGSDAAAAPALEKDGWTYSSAIPPGATHARYTRRRDEGEKASAP